MSTEEPLFFLLEFDHATFGFSKLGERYRVVEHSDFKFFDGPTDEPDPSEEFGSFAEMFDWFSTVRDHASGETGGPVLRAAVECSSGPKAEWIRKELADHDAAIPLGTTSSGRLQRMSIGPFPLSRTELVNRWSEWIEHFGSQFSELSYEQWLASWDVLKTFLTDTDIDHFVASLGEADPRENELHNWISDQLTRDVPLLEAAAMSYSETLGWLRSECGNLTNDDQ